VTDAPDSDRLAALERAFRVSDQSCTGYAILRDRYKRRAKALDIAILLISAWITAMVFAEVSIAERLSPPGVPKDLWLGLLSVGAFCLSLVQLQVSWKGRAQTYQQACIALSSFVKEYRPLLRKADSTAVQVALTRYQALAESIEPIPDSQFLALKKRHKLKVEISRHLDTHPAASLTLVRIALWWRDNKSSRRLGSK
jgi:hypothetical protein